MSEPLDDPTPDPPAAREVGRVLFGAAPEVGVFSPVPVVTIANRDVASGPGQVTGPEDLIAVDGFSVRWGRDELLAQPDPATGVLQLFDPTGTWATSRDLRGLPITLRWQGTPPGAADTVAEVFFRGRIGSPITVSPKRAVDPLTGQVTDGALVELPLRSILLDLANRVPTDAWPDETAGARLARILALSSGVLSSADLRDYWDVPHVAPVPANKQQSLLAHLTDLYDSAGADRMTFVPHTSALTYVRRRDYAGNRGTVGLWWDQTGGSNPTARAGQGVYARSFGWSPGGLPGWLDTGALEYDPAEGLRSAERITRVRVTNPDGGFADYPDHITEYLVAETDEAVLGSRVAAMTSIISWNSYANVAASDLQGLVTREGSAWQLQPLRFRSGLTGGFESLEQARIMLAGAETSTTVFLQRSWLPRHGIRPVFGIRGGVIGYRAGSWDIEMHLAPTTTSATPQHAITWDQFDSGADPFTVRWYDEDHPAGMHESLTYEDLGFVARGVNVSTIPADTGWDRAL